jgi:SAM-dependent methyltransferase
MNEATLNADVLPLRSYPCSICGSERTRILLRKAGVRVTRVFNIVGCVNCRHVYVNPRISDEALGRLYDEEYYRGQGFDQTIDYAGPASQYKLAEVAAVAGTVEAAVGRLKGIRWLDFGCGAGFLLAELLERGADAVGFDDSAAALQRCAEKGLPVATQSQIEAGAGSFDVISAVEVIEHVPDPRSFLRYLVSFLRVGGIAYVQTGNWNVVRRLPGTPYVMPEGHIHYFTPPELRRLFREVGLEYAPTLNRSWFPWRDMPPALRRYIPLKVYETAATLACAVAPGYGPFPIGIRAS